MMHSLCLDDSDTDVDWDRIDHRYANAAGTPSTSSPELNAQNQRYGDGSDVSDDDEYGGPTKVVQRNPGRFDSRIEQILYNSPDQPILIVDGGKSVEGGGKYIVYTIRTGVSL